MAIQAFKKTVIFKVAALALSFGLMLESVASDESERFSNIKAFAEQGYALEQAYLGSYYEDGTGVRQDYEKALYWYRKSANQNNPISQFMLGLMYEYGKGVKQNRIVAKEWYGKSCDNGTQIGCDTYRELNEQGY